ncbi:MAG: YgiQ family radical SAM protein, partial [Desulfatitalea sp.]|nr:YgiQ family radical SAM protein [Desulfatitalea sp.]
MPTAISPTAYVPTTPEEVRNWGWSDLDVILVTGDTYIDAPQIGAAVIARVLLAAGFRVGIIAQPDVVDGRDITRLGEPVLFWGVTGGSVDSMVANYTAAGRRRRSDDLTPGGRNTRRPDRAVLVYSHLIRRHFKKTRPIVLGGIEASLRRISHYDAWNDAVRRSVLFDAKADFLLYGMADETVVALATKLQAGQPPHTLRGLCYISPQPPPVDVEHWPGPDVTLPSHATVDTDPQAFARMFALFYANADPWRGRRLIQQQDTRYLVQNPPAPPPSPAVLDAVHELPYARALHPFYAADGPVAALETIRFSLTTHRGCFGECRFCAIAVHQGRQV